MAKNKFLQGTLILFMTSIVLKVLGFLYQIVIIRLVGTEPVGVLNMAYPFYIAFVVIATAGIPLALSKMVSEQLTKQSYQAVCRVMSLSFKIVAGLGFVFLMMSMVLMPLFFEQLGSDQRVRWCFYVLIPGIFIVPFASIIRGYFQGIQQMIYPSIAQVAEQITRLAAGMTLVIWLKPLGVMYVAMGLAAGMMVGEIVGLLVIGGFYFRTHRKLKMTMTATGSHGDTTKGLLGQIAYLGIPTTLTKLTSSVDMAVEASLIPYCLLQIGYNHSQAASIYGQFCGVALSLLTIPMVLTSALSTALVPAIAESSVRGHRKDLSHKCSQALRITYIFSLPVIVVLFLEANGLGMILFNIDGIGSTVKVLSLGALFLYLGQTSVGILQGLGLTRVVFINNFIGSIIKLVCLYYLILLGDLGIDGIAWAFVLSYIGQCLLNLLVLAKKIPIKLTFGQVTIPMILVMFMIGCLYGCRYFGSGQFSEPILILGSIVLAGLFYLIMLVLTKQFSFRDLS